MADDNLKEFSINWILIGLLFFSMITFAVLFMFSNNPDGLGDSGSVFNDTQSGLQSKLVATEITANELQNITASTNPEESYLGSRDSVATTYGIAGDSRGFFDSVKLFMGWIISGTAGQIVVGSFAGIFGLLFLYFVTKWIRNGL